MWGSNRLARSAYATAKIAVWWDMYDCPIPEGYDAGRVRPSMEEAFRNLGYSGPVSIYAYGDQKEAPDPVLRELSSSGVDLLHTGSRCRWSRMFSDMLEWRDHNPPPATMMLISNHVEDVFTWDLVRLQQRTTYNIFLAYSFRPKVQQSLLSTSAEWRWDSLLDKATIHKDKCSVSVSSMFYCKSCEIGFQSLGEFRKHLSSRNHAVQEIINPGYKDLNTVTRTWGRNYPAEPVYATAQIAVWWDMMHCPIPEGYDATRVRPCLEEAFKSLGYSGPVSIYAFGDLKQIPDHLLLGLSSTGVALFHAISEVASGHMFSSMGNWQIANPPPATMMIISNPVDNFFSNAFALLQQQKKYNIFMAYSYRPYKMLLLVTSAKWLWDSLLSVSDTRRQVVRRCSERERPESTVNVMICCKLCSCDCKGLDNFRKHLSSSEHARQEDEIHASFRKYQRNQEQALMRQAADSTKGKASPRGCDESDMVANIPKRKRLRKASPLTFRLLHNHLRR